MCIRDSYSPILKTTDGGTTWNILSDSIYYSLRGVSFTDTNNGTAVGVSGLILRTTNGGEIWTKQLLGTSSALYDVSFTDSNNGTAIGDALDGISKGIILRTTNGLSLIHISEPTRPY